MSTDPFTAARRRPATNPRPPRCPLEHSAARRPGRELPVGLAGLPGTAVELAPTGPTPVSSNVDHSIGAEGAKVPARE